MPGQGAINTKFIKQFMALQVITTLLGFVWAAAKVPFTLFTLLFFALAELTSFSIRALAAIRSYLLIMAASIPKLVGRIRGLGEKKLGGLLEEARATAKMAPRLFGRSQNGRIELVSCSKLSQQPQEQAESEKNLVLMQKIRRLEETMFQESVDRRRTEQELFNLRLELSERNAALARHEAQNAELLSKNSSIGEQMQAKNDEVEAFRQKVAQLEDDKAALTQRLLETQKRLQQMQGQIAEEQPKPEEEEQNQSRGGEVQNNQQ